MTEKKEPNMCAKCQREAYKKAEERKRKRKLKRLVLKFLHDNEFPYY